MTTFGTSGILNTLNNSFNLAYKAKSLRCFEVQNGNLLPINRFSIKENCVRIGTITLEVSFGCSDTALSLMTVADPGGERQQIYVAAGGGGGAMGPCPHPAL